MMFGRLIHRSPRIGSEVTVLVGPYAGFTGRVSEIDRQGRFRVFIDDCCQPVVDLAELTVGIPHDLEERIAAAGQARKVAREHALVR